MHIDFIKKAKLAFQRIVSCVNIIKRAWSISLGPQFSGFCLQLRVAAGLTLDLFLRPFPFQTALE